MSQLKRKKKKENIVELAKKKPNTKYVDFKNAINQMIDALVSSNSLFYNKENLKS